MSVPLRYPRVGFSVFVTASIGAWSTVCPAFLQAQDGLSNRHVVESVLASLESRESFILDHGFHATLRLEERNPPNRHIVTHDGHKGAIANASGDVVNRVEFWAHRDRWRMNVSHQNAKDMPVVPAETSLEWASNGVEFSHVDRRYGIGNIARRELAKTGMLRGNTSLPIEYWLVRNSVRLSERFRKVQNRITLDTSGKDGKDGARRYTVRVPRPEKDDPAYVLTVVAERGFALESMETYFSRGIRSRRMVVSRDRQVGGGVWIPEQWSIQWYGPKDGKSVKMAIHRRWTLLEAETNIDIVPATFQVDFPKGTKVTNNITGEGYQAGLTKGAPPDIEQFRRARQLPYGDERDDQGGIFWSLILGGVFLAAALLSIAIFTVFRRTRSEL